jgi:adenylosuccinate lyase
MHPSPLTPLGWLHLQLRTRLDRLGHGHERELGVSTVEWVIITAILVGIAATIGVIIYNFVINQGSPPPQSPPAPGGP